MKQAAESHSKLQMMFANWSDLADSFLWAMTWAGQLSMLDNQYTYHQHQIHYQEDSGGWYFQHHQDLLIPLLLMPKYISNNKPELPCE